MNASNYYSLWKDWIVDAVVVKTVNAPNSANPILYQQMHDVFLSDRRLVCCTEENDDILEKLKRKN